MGRCINGGIVGGIIIFIWYMISWMVLPWHMMTILNFKDDNAVVSTIQANAPVSGMYFSPAMQQGDMKNVPEPKGPMVFSSVNLEGMKSMTQSMIIGLISQIIAAFFVAWMLLQTRGLGYIGRLGFVILFAIATSIIAEVPNWNWFGFDLHYSLVGAADILIGWFLAGLVMAGICRPRY